MWNLCSAIGLFLNFVLAVVIVGIINFCLCYKKKDLSDIFYVAIALAFWMAFTCILFKYGLQFILICFGGFVLFAVLIKIQDLYLKRMSKGLNYDYTSVGKSSLFYKKKVMIIVPHEDDDLNIASGIVEQYLNGDSNVYVVFTTNGDYWDIGEVRINEAINAFKYYGIPENHVIFLGYADGWDEENLHIYNAGVTEECKSRNGHTETYGTDRHPAYNEGALYTCNNYLNDIKTVILEYLPDTIICSDFDAQIEHKATTLFFEKAMGEILKEKKDYHPTVLKAFAYCTAWKAPKDFYKINLLSTIEPSQENLFTYRWKDRIRLPICGEKCSRSLINCELYKVTLKYKSQRANLASRAFINGDKVYWLRRTDSLLYAANIEVSSGNAKYLTDFMLLNSDNLFDNEHEPFDGVWIPDQNDSERTVWISFDKATNLENIVLYENPSLDDHITKLKVTLSNGTVYVISDIDACGTNLIVNQKNITGFSIELIEVSGNRAGLTEVEAYPKRNVHDFSYVKIMDEDENFVYDYVIDGEGKQNFKLYYSGKFKDIDSGLYKLVCDNDSCIAQIVGNSIYINCPVEQKCHIYLYSLEGDTILDMITIRNPSDRERHRIEGMMKYEEMRYLSIQWIFKQTILYKYRRFIRNMMVLLRNRFFHLH